MKRRKAQKPPKLKAPKGNTAIFDQSKEVRAIARERVGIVECSATEIAGNGLAALAIGIAWLFDSLDGAVARAMGTNSAFGKDKPKILSCKAH